MANIIKTHKFPNGMTLIVEEMPERVSAAFNIVVDAGAARDKDGLCGTANVLSEIISRGAGNYSNIELNQALDRLGVHYNNSAGLFISSFSGVLTNNNLPETMAIFADIVLRPHLDEKEYPNCQALAIQALESLEDDPRQKVSILAKETFICPPLNRPTMGKISEIGSMTCDDVKQFWKNNFTPTNSIITVAGGVEFEEIKDMIEELFGQWHGSAEAQISKPSFTTDTSHLKNDGSQTHISLAWPSIHISDNNYYKAVLLANVLSGGMGSRLFTEVREKRGLCYSVGANHIIIGDKGAMMAYVGSSPDNAQEALDVIVTELNKLKDGISQDELDRARIGLRASLIMQGESSSARSISMANDYFHLKRTRTLQEIEDALNSVTIDSLMEYVSANPAGNFSLTAIGPREVKLPQ